MKPGFSPVALYERGRQEATANQPRYYERFRELLPLGLAIVTGKGEKKRWFVLAPSSRLELRVLFAQDLAVDGAAGLHRIEFDELNFYEEENGAAGWFDAGERVAGEFRPIPETEDPAFVDLWNERSGCKAVKLAT